jgi:proline racemase
VSGVAAADPIVTGIERAAADQIEVIHPENPDIPRITNIEFTGPLQREVTVCGHGTR